MTSVFIDFVEVQGKGWVGRGVVTFQSIYRISGEQRQPNNPLGIHAKKSLLSHLQMEAQLSANLRCLCKFITLAKIWSSSESLIPSGLG
jgi:hypothetical protein